MVDETKKTPGPVVRSGFPRKKPGPVPTPSDTKSERLMMRIHPDLMKILTERARERGINRSQYIEKLLIGWVNTDPRNHRLDMIGKVNRAAPSPPEIRRRSALEFTDRWRKFCAASELLLGYEPPREWFDHWEQDSGFYEPDPDPEDDGNYPIPPSFMKFKRK